MAGVEILHSSEVFVSGGFNEEIFAIVLIASVVIGYVIGAIISIINLDAVFVLFGSLIGVVLGLLSGAIMGNVLPYPEVYETHYKVSISDEVSINEFLEEYEIIDQEGKIYTVKEKESAE